MTLQNELVLGIMSSCLDHSLELRTNCVEKLKMNSGHSANDVAKVLRFVVFESLLGRVDNCFVSDSALAKKAAVGIYMVEEGERCWFPYSVGFLQLKMHDSVSQCLNETQIA